MRILVAADPSWTDQDTILGARIGRRFTYRADGWAGSGRTLVGDRPHPGSTRIEAPNGDLAVARSYDESSAHWFHIGSKSKKIEDINSFNGCWHAMWFAELAACRAMVGSP